MTIVIPPGVFDILPNDAKEPWRSSPLWNYVEDLIRQTAKDFGFSDIRTPMFERTELFQRGVGETSDIVSKEMYTFQDKGGRSMSLKPEGTAPVIRAFIEKQLYQEASIHKFYYIAPMFRYERSQAGRYRQHHQFGAEAIGEGAPEQDVELIDLLYTFYSRLGLKNLELHINSIGNPQCRIAYRTALQDYLRASYDKLSPDSQARFNTNPLRILDSKNLQDQELIAGAPSILDFLDADSKDHFDLVLKLLTQLKIPHKINSQLVRGLDYYNKTVFEIITGDLGAQNSIGGGGRYDGLMKQLGGPDLPTIGFGTGLERIIQTLLKQQAKIPKFSGPTIFLIALGDSAREASFQLLHQLRQRNISAQMDFSNRKLGKIMQTADQAGSKFVAVIGDNELATQTLELKEMATGNKLKVHFNDLEKTLTNL